MLFNIYDRSELVLQDVPANHPAVMRCVPDKPLAALGVGESTLLRWHRETYRISRVA